MTKQVALTLRRGETFQYVVRWGVLPYIHKAITAITQAAPARITAAGHGLVDQWPVAIVGVNGMRQINACNNPPKDWEFRPATRVDSDTITLNNLSSAAFLPYTSGGFVMYYTPQDLAGYTARMKIKDRVGGTVLASTEAGDAPKNTITVTLDNSAKTITVQIADSDTTGFTWSTGVFDLELESNTGITTRLLSGTVDVETEVTTA